MYPIQDFSIPPAVVPEFVPTDVAAVAGIARTVADTFRARTTRPLEWRRVQLRRLYWALHDLQPLLTDALMRDLHRPPYETVLTELVMVADDCILALANLDRWAADERVTDMPLPLRALGHTVHKEPLGPVLVIGTYNFPLQMCLNPLVGAIAAGCTAVIKPSENAPATAAAIAHLVRERLDASAFAVVNGPVDRATALLDAGDDPATRWGKILYTGNQHVAKIIARRAADSLTPCILELGGNNPAVVTNAADVSLAARRILWAVAVNAGQVCVKPNYVLVQRGVVDEFIAATRRHIAAFFPDGARQSPDFARMVNQAQFARVRGMIEGTNGTVVAGGETDEDELYIEPTYILVDDPSDPAMKDEAFGPLVAVLPFDDLDEAIAVANATCATPLAVYVFGSKSESEKGGLAECRAMCHCPRLTSCIF
jgi:beta-apo-4'-carotenal oxygenase